MIEVRKLAMVVIAEGLEIPEHVATVWGPEMKVVFQTDTTVAGWWDNGRKHTKEIPSPNHSRCTCAGLVKWLRERGLQSFPDNCWVPEGPEEGPDNPHIKHSCYIS